MHRQALHPKGFTLVELLVVVAIIGLLISIFLPAMGAARAQSKFVVCRANLRTIGQLVQVYATQNNDRIPRGPSFQPASYPFSLLGEDIATTQLWTTAYEVNDEYTHQAEFTGLGLLARAPGKAGNEFLFCPDDAALNLTEEGPRIGQPETNAFGSYLYRQMDIMPQQIQSEGKLDNLQACDFEKPPVPPDLGGELLRLEVQALALDSNSLGSGVFEHLNHDGQRVNVVYKDGSTKPFDNELQRIPSRGLQHAGGSASVPWASIPAAAFADYPAGVLWALDRIFVAADYSFIGEEPWLRAPLPP